MNVLIIGGMGYIGSAIFQYLHSHQVQAYRMDNLDTIDLEWFGRHINCNDRRDYRTLSSRELTDYDAVIMVAAHSSVAMCQKDPYGAFCNNVENFVGLLRKLESIQKQNRPVLIYASSSCVYTGTPGFAIEGQELPPPVDHLTLTKQTIDYYAQMSDVDFYGLRLGSVNGWSPNLRSDLMINAMTLDSIYDKKVYVTNAQMWRPILGTQDLCSAIHKILQTLNQTRNCETRGIYNLCSFNETIGRIGELVAAMTGAEVVDRGSPGGYDFKMSNIKFETVFDWEPKESASTIAGDLQLSIAATKAPPTQYAKGRDVNKEYRTDGLRETD